MDFYNDGFRLQKTIKKRRLAAQQSANKTEFVPLARETVTKMVANCDFREIWDAIAEHVINDVIATGSHRSETPVYPVPCLLQAARFNTLGIFVENQSSDELHNTYLGNLREAIASGHVNEYRWKRLVDVKGDFEPLVESYDLRAGESQNASVAIQVLNVYKWESLLTELKTGDVYISRSFPGLETVEEINVVTEVWTAGRILIEACCDEEGESWRTWDLEGPMPIAFSLTKFPLESDGKMVALENKTDDAKVDSVDQVADAQNTIMENSQQKRKCAKSNRWDLFTVRSIFNKVNQKLNRHRDISPSCDVTCEH